MTTHENTPEVVESWGKDLLNRFYALYEQGKNKGAPQSFIDFFEARAFLYHEVTSQKQKQIEEIVGIVTHMPNATRDEVHNEKVICVDDFITKIQAKQ